jgi:hypothetical protein
VTVTVRKFGFGALLGLMPWLVVAREVQPLWSQVARPAVGYVLESAARPGGCDPWNADLRVARLYGMDSGAGCRSAPQALSSPRRGSPNGWILVGSLTVVSGAVFAVVLPEAFRTAPYLFLARCDSCSAPSALESAAIGAGVGAAVGLAICLLSECDWGAPGAARSVRRAPRRRLNVEFSALPAGFVLRVRRGP